MAGEQRKSGLRQYGKSEREATSAGGQATAEQVEQFHTNSDVDVRRESQHHTLGSDPNQASPGDHRHDGGDSAFLLGDVVITGSRNSDAWRQSVMAALVRLGAKDSSTS